MSIPAYKAVWKLSAATQSALIVLLALAEHANDAGDCWPSIPTIATETKIKPRQVQNLIYKLIEMGEITVTERGVGKGNTNHYHVNLVDQNTQSSALPSAPKHAISERNTQSGLRQIGELKHAIFDQNTQSSAPKHAISAPAIYKVPVSEPPENRHIEPSLRAHSSEGVDHLWTTDAPEESVCCPAETWAADRPVMQTPLSPLAIWKLANAARLPGNASPLPATASSTITAIARRFGKDRFVALVEFYHSDHADPWYRTHARWSFGAFVKQIDKLDASYTAWRDGTDTRNSGTASSRRQGAEEINDEIAAAFGAAQGRGSR